MRLCVLGAVADLHAAEARYDNDSMRRLFSNRMNPTGQENNPHISTSECQPDMALKHKIAMLSSDRKRIWNSVELFQKYQAHGGFNLTRSHLVDNLCRHFDWELLILSSPGYANIVAFWMSSITVTEDGERRRYRQQHP